MDAILTFDVGTTAIKTGLFRRDLTCLAIRTDEYWEMRDSRKYIEYRP